MNAPDSFLTANIGAAEVRVPREAAVAAYLEQELDRLRPIPLATAQSAERLEAALEARTHLAAPAIGGEWQGGMYAGLTLAQNAPAHLVLLPGDASDISWKGACEWARQQGGELPSRMDQLVLWQNLRGHFERAYYWSSEEYASDAEFAWLQNFSLGNQVSWPKSDETRARAVRRIPI